jgi:hypothetical protein
MPFRPNLRKETEKVANLVGTLIFPALLSVNIPGFLYQIVQEKEQRLLQNMKINGMRMRNYWMVNYLFNLTIYLITASSFFLFGLYIADFSFFVETARNFLLASIFGWGLNAVSLAFFLSCFLNSS